MAKTKIVSSKDITAENLTAQHYITKVTCECVGAQRHRKDFDSEELKDGHPLCDACGQPMLPIKGVAELMKGYETVTIDSLPSDPDELAAVQREVERQSKKPKKRAKRRR